MTREELKKIVEGITSEQVNAILDIHSTDIGKAKGDYEAMKADLEKATKQVETMTEEIGKLKEGNASAEDYKAKFEQLKADWDNEKAETKKAQAKAEKEANLTNRFNAVVGEKKFSHPAIQADYLSKFMTEVEKPENAGKADSEILSTLTKDDSGAFVGNTVQVNLVGGKAMGTQRMSREDIKKIKDPIERQTAIKNNISEFLKTEE